MDEYEVENYWEDDLYQMNQNEADDYRHELDEDRPMDEDEDDAIESLEDHYGSSW